jgi:hypothetical protein
MAISRGKTFRRLLDHALSLGERERGALIERILPRGEDGKRALRLESEDDRQAAPLAVVAAFSIDAITGDEAEELKRQTEAWSHAQVRSPEKDPLKEALLALDAYEDTQFVIQGDRLVRVPRTPGDLSRRGAADEAGVIVKNNENTMATAEGGAASEKANPL